MSDKKKIRYIISAAVILIFLIFAGIEVLKNGDDKSPEPYPEDLVAAVTHTPTPFQESGKDIVTGDNGPSAEEITPTIEEEKPADEIIPVETLTPTQEPVPTETPTPTQEPTPTEIPAPTVEATPAIEATPTLIDENGSYTKKDDVALYLHTYKKLPSNFITKKEAKKLGWEGGGLEAYAPGKCIGGDYFGNNEGVLPKGDYRECDIDTLGKKSRGSKRIVYDVSDWDIYFTSDHYETFKQIY